MAPAGVKPPSETPTSLETLSAKEANESLRFAVENT